MRYLIKKRYPIKFQLNFSESENRFGEYPLNILNLIITRKPAVSKESNQTQRKVKFLSRDKIDVFIVLQDRLHVEI